MTKSILCFGDSITWGFDPRNGSRFPFADRWPRVLEAALQGRARIIEEGLNGRTVATDEPSRPYRNGLAMLPPLLETHAPLDVVVFLLGTNDSAPSYGLTAGKIAYNCSALIRAVRASLAGPGDTIPRIVLIAPPPFGSLSAEMALFYSGGQTASRGLATAYQTLTERFEISFLDAGTVTKASTVDGVHLDQDGQQALGLAVSDVVERLL